MEAEVSAILDEIEQLTAHCWHFERKYGLSSERFAELYEQGRIADDTTEVREDIVVWVGCFRALQNRREKLRQLEKNITSPILR